MIRVASLNSVEDQDVQSMPIMKKEIKLHKQSGNKQGGVYLADSKLAVMEVSNNNNPQRLSQIKRSSVLVQNRDE